jgi:predicted ATPase
MQSRSAPRRVVVTGGPGCGKTTILDHIKAHGYDVEPEAARILIQNQLQRDEPILPWTDRVAFDRLLLPVLRKGFERARPGQTIFYDRAVPDLIGWALYDGLDPSTYLGLAKQYLYDRTVYFVRGNPKHYQANVERPYTFAQVQSIHDRLLEGYGLAGYNVRIIPARETTRDTVIWLLSDLGLRS